MGSTNLCSDGSSVPGREELAKLFQGQVVCVDLDPSLGREQKKCRPCVIVSATLIHQNLDTLQVVPFTAAVDESGKAKRLHNLDILVPKGEGGLLEDSIAEPLQVRTIDRYKRVTKIVGIVSPPTMQSIRSALTMIFYGTAFLPPWARPSEK